jgi:hypothetical protein
LLTVIGWYSGWYVLEHAADAIGVSEAASSKTVRRTVFSFAPLSRGRLQGFSNRELHSSCQERRRRSLGDCARRRDSHVAKRPACVARPALRVPVVAVRSRRLRAIARGMSVAERIGMRVVSAPPSLLALTLLSTAALAQEKPPVVGASKAKVALASAIDPRKPAPEQEREALRREVATFGLLALVKATFADELDQPKRAPSWPSGVDSVSAKAKASEPLWRSRIDDALVGDIRLTSAEDAGPGSFVPPGAIATIGGGEGGAELTRLDGRDGRVPETHVARAPLLRAASAERARILPETIQRVVRDSFGRFRVCYEGALRHNPSLRGRMAVKLTIDPDGSVGVASDAGSDLPDDTVVSCVVRSFASLSFPSFASGTVTVVYPLVFTPMLAR